MYELINNVPLQIKEYNGQRVVTFKDIDRVHNRPEGTAGRNFRTNREHFIEGEDFYKITPDEFRRTIGYMDSRQSNNVILITENGYLMLVKSFTDDLAWSVQRQLVNTYFKAQVINHSYAELLKLYNDMNSDIEEIKNTVKTLDKNADRRMNSVIKAIKESIMETSCTTAQSLIPCFLYTHKKLKKLHKKLNNK